MHNQSEDQRELDRLKAQFPEGLPVIFLLSKLEPISETTLQLAKRKLPIQAFGSANAQKRPFYKEITTDL